MNLATFLISLVGPMLARILASLGLTLVSLAGLTAAASALKSVVTSNIGGMPLVAIQLGGLFGVWEALGIIFGAITFCVTWQSTSGFWKLAKA